MFELTSETTNLLSALVMVLTLAMVIIAFAEGAGEVVAGLFKDR